MDQNEFITRRIIFQGRVQGIGFRWTTVDLSKRFDVEGTVKNLRDGTVEVIVQAQPPEVQRFVSAILNQMAGNITSHDVTECEVGGPFNGFSIAY